MNASAFIRTNPRLINSSNTVLAHGFSLCNQSMENDMKKLTPQKAQKLKRDSAYFELFVLLSG